MNTVKKISISFGILLLCAAVPARASHRTKYGNQFIFDNKRKADEVKNQEYSNPNEFLEYKRRKQKEVELLKTVPADLKQYYKNKVNEYFNKVD